METVKEYGVYLLTTLSWFLMVAGAGLFFKLTFTIFLLGWNIL